MKTISPFVSIKTIFDTVEIREIEKLANFYQDINFLTATISDLLAEKLPDEIVSGKKILLKPNWVLHDKRTNDHLCMRTHNNFILAALSVILTKKPALVTVGDAPVQGCIWEQVVNPEFLGQVEGLSQLSGIPVVVQDFRRVTFNPGNNKLVEGRKPLSDYVILDLGKESYLEPITIADQNAFRVTDYHPDRLSEAHAPGMHKYCITKALFEHDIIISMPKVKTHQKAGLTNALKNIVGLNGDKDFLPHHRVGGTGFGGDCYPGGNPIRRLSELAMDTANRNRGKQIYRFWQKIATGLWRLSFPSSEHSLAAAWYGNDTTWRMVLDLNKIVEFGKIDGTISTNKQRTLFHLCDGIVGGQGDGPLKPDPLPLGLVCFSNHASTTDVAMGYLMEFPVEHISLLKNAIESTRQDEVELLINGEKIKMRDLSDFSIPAIPPPGWIKYYKHLKK